MFHIFTSTLCLNILVLLLSASQAKPNRRNFTSINDIIESEYGFASLLSPASHLKDEVDILKLLNLTSKGVVSTEGPIKGYPAYKFRLQYGDPLITYSTPITTAISSNDGFTVVFVFRQQRNTIGTLLSLNPPGRVTPWFQITSNMRTGNLIVHYRLSPTGKLYQTSWPLGNHHRKLPLAAWTWLSVSADYNTSTLRLDVDCLPSRFEHLTLKEPAGQNGRVAVPRDSLVYFRQEPGNKKKFLGTIQVAKIIPHVTHHRLWTCHEISETNSPENRKPVLYSANRL